MHSGASAALKYRGSRSLRRRRPRFSIVLATKNGMPFVREAVASLEAQTLDDYEVVIQDAASSDGTTEFLRQPRLSNACVVSEPDSGLGDAYNRAFPRCRGEIVGILDSDNLLVPNALEVVDALFLRHRTAVAIYGAVRMIDAAGKQVGSFVPEAFDQGALMRCESARGTAPESRLRGRSGARGGCLIWVLRTCPSPARL